MDQREVVLYTGGRSLRGWRAKRLLRRGGYQFEVLDTTNHPEVRAELLDATHREVALPYVLIDHRPVGGFGVIKALSRSGDLAHLLRDEI
jgi:glutaredoxin-related protein